MGTNSFTARQLSSIINKSQSRSKKRFIYSGFHLPVTPITARTYDTGKHGTAKTSLLLKSPFTNSSFQQIVNADEQFTDANLSPNYLVRQGLFTITRELQLLKGPQDIISLQFINEQNGEVLSYQVSVFDELIPIFNEAIEKAKADSLFNGSLFITFESFKASEKEYFKVLEAPSNLKELFLSLEPINQ